ncbi:alpha/beta fold hydrolase [Nocardia sp. NPDC051750]|uniref:alpha/beta fold hydrolase n=1 Tax=Nocardia sp. NPDC051750 TaxID=3364325 RepID=UPI00379358AA
MTPPPETVRDTGPADGSAVVLLHSLFFDGSMFDALVAELPARHRYIRPDLRGQGSFTGSGRAPTMDVLFDDAVALIESRCNRPVHLVGSSMGAYVALRVASRRPDLLASCTLLGATAEAEARPEIFRALETAVRGNEPDIVARIEHTMFGDVFLGDTARSATRRHWAQVFAAHVPEVADALHGVYTRPAMVAELAAIPLPLLLVAGELDRAKRPADMAAIADRVPGSRLVVLETAGHTPVIEEPAAIARELVSWWATPPNSPHPDNGGRKS